MLGAGSAFAYVAVREPPRPVASEDEPVAFLERVRAAGAIDHYTVDRQTRHETRFVVDDGDVTINASDFHGRSSLLIYYQDAAFSKARAVFRSACRDKRAGHRIAAIGRWGIVEQCPALARMGSQPLAIHGSNEVIPAPSGSVGIPEHIHGNRLFRTGVEALGRLRAPLLAPLLSQSSVLALPSPTRGEILYHAWAGPVRGAGIPVLRIYNSEGGPERVLVRGGQSAAWRRDGAIAYLRATPPRYVPTQSAALGSGGNYGQVVVRATADAPPVRWTKEQRRRYIVLGWARSTLLVQIEPSHLLRDRRPPGIYALAGPGRLRSLPLRELIAISPDGRRAIGSFGQGDGPSRSVRVVDVASGRVLASLALRTAGGPGDWEGSTVVVSLLAGRESELAILRVRHRSISVVQRLRIGNESSLRGAYGPFLSRPVFVGSDRHFVALVASHDAEERTRFAGFLTCDRIAGRCVRGRNLTPATTWAAVIDNPSRPEPGGG